MTDSEMQNIRAIAEQAADWYLRVEEEGSVPLAERQRFVSWLKASPAHISEFMRVAATHSQMAGLDVSELPGIKELLQQAQSNVVALRDQPADGPAMHVAAPRKSVVWAMAASIAAVALSATWHLALRSPTMSPETVVDNVYETDLGEQRSVLLSDGSVVALNTQTRLQVRFNDDSRRVDLTAGEAVFDVASDPSRPFRVAVGPAVVEAVGTRFNVYRQTSQTVVTVIEGRVAVSGPESAGSTFDMNGLGASAIAGAVELVSGHQVAVSSAGTMSEKAVVDTNKAVAWTDRRLVFDGDPLATVARELNRYNRQQLVIADAALAQRPVSGVFDANDPATLLAFLEAVGGMRVEAELDGRGWKLYPAAETGSASAPH